jgi:hypothetical protein
MTDDGARRVHQRRDGRGRKRSDDEQRQPGERGQREGGRNHPPILVEADREIRHSQWVAGTTAAVRCTRGAV